MKATRLRTAWLAMNLGVGLIADANDTAAPARPALTNTAVSVIAKVRQVPESDVKLRMSSERTNGPFEIDLKGAADWQREANELSKEFGSAAAVIVDHVSPDGRMRTNWTFRGGIMEMRTAPVASTNRAPKAQRRYVWPQAKLKPAAPVGLRVRGTAD